MMTTIVIEEVGWSRQALDLTTWFIQDWVGGVQGTVGLGWRPRKEATVAELRTKAGRGGSRWGILRGLPAKVLKVSKLPFLHYFWLSNWKKGLEWFSSTGIGAWGHFWCWHIVWKLLKMSHLNFWIVAFSTNFCPINSDLSGNTAWPLISEFQKIAKIDHF